MNLSYGDICIYLATPKTESITRETIGFGEWVLSFFKRGTNPQAMHAGIYVGQNPDNIPIGHTRQMIVGMERDGLGTDNVAEFEHIVVFRLKNKILSDYLGDLALHWAKHSSAKYSILSCFETLMPHQPDIAPQLLSSLETEINGKLKENFMCSQFVISCLYVSIDMLNKTQKAELKKEDYINLSPFTSPAEFLNYLSQNPQYDHLPPQEFHEPPQASIAWDYKEENEAEGGVVILNHGNSAAATKIQAAFRGYRVRDHYRDPNKITHYKPFYNEIKNMGFFQEYPDYNPWPWYSGNYDAKTNTVTLYRFVNWYDYLEDMIKKQLPLIPRGISKLIASGQLQAEDVYKIQKMEENYKLKIPANHPLKNVWDLFCEFDKSTLLKYLNDNSDETMAGNPDELIVYWTTDKTLTTQGSWQDSDTCIEIKLPKNDAFRIVSEDVDVFEKEWDTFGALPFQHINQITRKEVIVYTKEQQPRLEASPYHP